MSSANTLTGLIPVLYESLDVVSRELVGFIPAVSIDASAEAAALNQTIRVPMAPASSAVSITPANVAPDSGGQVIGYTDITISKQYSVPVQWTGDEKKSLAQHGNNVVRDQFSQAMRTLTNLIEADLAGLYTYASRAYGTAGTAPFGSSLNDAAQVGKILDDNGCPDDGQRKIVLGTAANVNLLGLSNLNTVYASGSDATLRRGIIPDIFGFNIGKSAAIKAHTKGTGTGYVIVAAGEDAGQTTISMDGGNSGTIKAGDIVTFGTGGGSGTGLDFDTKYVVRADGAAAAAKDIVLNAPGLRVARVNDDACTVGSSYTANMAFHKSSIQLVTRAPMMPEGGDSADDIIMITDPVSGLTFQIAMYRQYRQVHYEIGIAWGFAAIKPEHIALIIG
jgi:hypothetical protein